MPKLIAYAMDPIDQFNKEKQERIDAYSCDPEFRNLSRDWLRISMDRMYVYNFNWLNRPIIQYPHDIVGMQELIWAVKPDLIIETGIAHGGSLIFSASMLALIDYCEAALLGKSLDPLSSQRKVIGVDIDIRAHNKKAIEEHPLAHSILMIEGSSIEPTTIAKVKDAAKKYERVLVCLDSMHTHEHVLAELEAYAPLVTPGSYCVVFDTFIEDMPPQFFSNRPWDVGNNPKTAVRQWLKAHSEFEIDAQIEGKLLVSVAPEGYLKRIR